MIQWLRFWNLLHYFDWQNLNLNTEQYWNGFKILGTLWSWFRSYWWASRPVNSANPKLNPTQNKPNPKLSGFNGLKYIWNWMENVIYSKLRQWWKPYMMPYFNTPLTNRIIRWQEKVKYIYRSISNINFSTRYDIPRDKDTKLKMVRI